MTHLLYLIDGDITGREAYATIGSVMSDTIGSGMCDPIHNVMYDTHNVIVILQTVMTHASIDSVMLQETTR